MKVKEIVEEIMINNGLSQEKLAKKLGVSQKAISNWLNGVDTPKASSMILIYKEFGITLNELLGIEEYETTKKAVIYNHSTHNGNNNF